MRTLSRPMFNMGGPIKQGIMHGIREPYAGGGRAALVGNPLYPRTGGREHHFAAKVAQVAAPKIISKGLPHIKRGWEAFKNIFGKTKPATTRQKYHGYGSDVDKLVYTTEKVPGGFVPKSWLERDPIFKGGRWIKEAVTGPTAKTWGKKIAQGVATPTGALTIGYFGGKWLWPDGTEATDDEVKKELNKKKGGKDYGPHTKGGPTITQEMRDAKAKADKEKRINALLDTMGYDKARKNAAYDALIDAGRMVSERGTLDPKNIGRELIDPIVATTSARFDKPEQIREAVGLMQVKADIAKQMEDPQIKELRAKQIAQAEKSLAGNTLSETIENYRVRQGTPTGTTLAAIARGEGIEAKVLYEKVPKNTDALEFITQVVTKSHEDGKPFPAGEYVISDRIISIDETGNVTPLDI